MAMTLLAPSPALAHAFGARYDLPIPLGLWLVGAGAVVALSFAILALFARSQRWSGTGLHFELTRLPLLRALPHPRLLFLLRLLSVFLLLLIVAAGLFGSQDSTANIATVLVWVVWWVGFTYLAALFGDAWRLVNPWDAIFRWAEALPTIADRPLRHYPNWLGAWPAVALFFFFAWLELASQSGEVPARLALLIVAYSALTWGGMFLVGRATWLGNADPFALVFALVSRFSISEARHDSENGRPVWLLRPPAVGLLVERPLPLPLVAFALLLLATVSFDGIAETPFWAAVLRWFAESQALRPLLLELQRAGYDLVQVIKTLGLIVAPLLFFVVYLFVSWLMARAGGGLTPLEVAGGFVLSLVPIAIAYHLAHYFSYLMLAGQLAIPLVSDPFGWGWDLFGTAGRSIDISVVSAKMVWYLATAAIVLGHVFAVYLGHVMALRLFADRRGALRSQLPLLILMVGYSMLSLWILAQPIVVID